MIEPELPRMQCDSAKSLILELFAKRHRRAILKVADHGMPARSALHTNLMRAPSLKLNLQPSIFSRVLRARAIRFRSDLPPHPRRPGYLAASKHTIAQN